MPDKFLTTAEIAATLGVSENTIRERARRKGIGSNIYPNGPRIFALDDLDSMRPGPRGHWPKGRSRKPPKDGGAV